MVLTTTSSNSNSKQDVYFEILETLCTRFMSLSPIEILNTDIVQVLDLYVACAISDYNKKKKEQWVTSKNATWY